MWFRFFVAPCDSLLSSWACQIDGVTETLEEQVSMSFVNFARTGNPNIAGLPGWAACTGEHLTTMIFDRQCEARTDCEEEMLEFAMKAAPPVRIDPSMFPVDEDALEEDADVPGYFEAHEVRLKIW